jgi:hypothetical protein
VAIESLKAHPQRTESEAKVQLARKRTVEILRFWYGARGSRRAKKPRIQESERYEAFRIMPLNASFLTGN